MTMKTAKIIPVFGPITSSVLNELVDIKYEFKKTKQMDINKNIFE